MENIKLVIIENPEDENVGFLDKIKFFYERNKKELWVIFGLLFLINLINPTVKMYKQYGGEGENMLPPGEKPGEGGQKKSRLAFLKKIKGNNFFTTMLSWMFSLVQSLITFAFLIIVLAILPGLPIFIFMFILFFILRARMASIKSL